MFFQPNHLTMFSDTTNLYLICFGLRSKHFSKSSLIGIYISGVCEMVKVINAFKPLSNLTCGSNRP